MTPNEAEARITDLTLRGKIAYNAQSGADAVSEFSTRKSARSSFTVKLIVLRNFRLMGQSCGSAQSTTTNIEKSRRSVEVG